MDDDPKPGRRPTARMVSRFVTSLLDRSIAGHNGMPPILAHTHRNGGCRSGQSTAAPYGPSGVSALVIPLMSAVAGDLIAAIEGVSVRRLCRILIPRAAMRAPQLVRLVCLPVRWRGRRGPSVRTPTPGVADPATQRVPHRTFGYSRRVMRPWTNRIKLARCRCRGMKSLCQNHPSHSARTS
jgi:hypothetical protein